MKVEVMINKELKELLFGNGGYLAYDRVDNKFYKVETEEEAEKVAECDYPEYTHECPFCKCIQGVN